MKSSGLKRGRGGKIAAPVYDAQPLYLYIFCKFLKPFARMGKGFFILLHLGMKSLKIALMLSIMFIASALSPVPAKALQNQDSITLAQPVFTGAENSKPDSILAVADAVPENQAQIKDLLIDTAAQIEAMPGKDATPTEWATWIAGAIAVVIAIWQYIKAGKYKAELNKKQGYTSG